MEKVKLSVIAVNHNSSALLKECFSSITSTAEAENLQFIIIDSGSGEEDVNNLTALKGQGAEIILHGNNIGYARAVNEGIRNAESDFVLITNPDVVYKPGSIQSMLNTLLQFPGCGAVGPRIWWDKRMTLLLPASELPIPHRIFLAGLASVSRSMHKIIFKRWVKKTLKYWSSVQPTKQEMLSGACIMTTRKVLDNVGVFDESFPLYFEDADWSLRVREAGYHLYMSPQAHIVHYYNQSAKQDPEASSRKFKESSEKYYEKHFGSLELFLLRFFLKMISGRSVMSEQYEERGIFNAPPSFKVKDVSKKLLLLSPVEMMIPSAGSFFKGDTFAISEDLWELLGEGRYYIKVIDLDCFCECGSWQWTKKA